MHLDYVAIDHCRRIDRMALESMLPQTGGADPGPPPVGSPGYGDVSSPWLFCSILYSGYNAI